MEKSSTHFKRLQQLITVALLLSVSCKNSSNRGKTDEGSLPYLIDIESSFETTHSLNLSLMGNSIEYVVLETTEDNLMARISGIWLNDSYIVASDGSQVYLFDRSGNYIRKIGSNGRGPGEYNTARLVVDPYNNLIRVNGTGQIVTYDFGGNYIGSWNYGFPTSQGIVIDANSMMFHEYNMPSQGDDNRYSWHIIDMEGDTLRSIVNTLPRFNTPGLIVNTSPLYIYGGDAHFMEFGVDTLYYFKGGEIAPYAIFNQGRYKMEPDFLATGSFRETLKDKTYIADIFESDKYLYIKQMQGIILKTIYSLFDKDSGEFFRLNDGALVNNIDGGVNFWPEVVIDDNILVDYVEAYDLLQYIDNIGGIPEGVGQANFQKLMDLRGQIDENSNPVLMMVRLK